jgi:hypothetical protein
MLAGRQVLVGSCPYSIVLGKVLDRLVRTLG